MELVKAGRQYLKATRRFNEKLDFRLSVEEEFCMGALEYLFKVSKTFIADAQRMVHVKGFEEEVKKFCDSIVREKPLITTDNLGKEMAQIIGRDKAVKGKGRLII